MLLRRTTRALYLAISCAILSAIALVLIPICDAFGEKMERILSNMIAALFWGSLLLEQFFFWIANAGRKKIQIQKKDFKGQKIVKSSLGMITFCANKEARIFDVFFLVTLIAIIVLIVVQVQSIWLVTLTLALLLLSINFHCLFNGTTYRYIKAINKMKKESKNT